MANFLDKANQSSLKSIYADAMKRAWKDKKMQDYCVKHAAYFVPMSDGSVVTIEKQSIRKDFWFGYSDCGQGMSFSECHSTIDTVNSDKANYFIAQNIRDIDEAISTLKELLDNTGNYKGYHGVKYCSDIETSKAHSFILIRYYDLPYYGDFKAISLTKDDINNLLVAYKQYRIDFIKRLNTYLKRFGTKHISTNSYWIDR